MKINKSKYIDVHFNDNELKEVLIYVNKLLDQGYIFTCGSISDDGKDFNEADLSGNDNFESCVELFIPINS